MNKDWTTIILIRHGQTEWNRVERFRGRADVPLNATGMAQARAVGHRLARGARPAAVYSSPLGRCLQTAEAIAREVGTDVRALEGLVDLDFGAWQGLTPAEVEVRYPALYRTWLTAPQDAVIPEGETLDQVRARAMAALEDAAARHGGQSIVLVSHKAVCKVLACALLGLDNGHFWHIEQDNGAINIFERRDNAYFVRTLNDTCHLDRS